MPLFQLANRSIFLFICLGHCLPTVAGGTGEKQLLKRNCRRRPKLFAYFRVFWGEWLVDERWLRIHSRRAGIFRNASRIDSPSAISITNVIVPVRRQWWCLFAYWYSMEKIKRNKTVFDLSIFVSFKNRNAFPFASAVIRATHTASMINSICFAQTQHQRAVFFFPSFFLPSSSSFSSSSPRRRRRRLRQFHDHFFALVLPLVCFLILFR